jgi:hypothetical protein
MEFANWHLKKPASGRASVLKNVSIENKAFAQSVFYPTCRRFNGQRIFLCLNDVLVKLLITQTNHALLWNTIGLVAFTG